MKRFALGLAAVTALATLTGCGDKDTADEPKAAASETTETPTESVEAAEDRFRVAYEEVTALFVELSEQGDAVDPTSTEEANTAAGLDESTPLVFADYTVMPEDESTGAFCIETDDDTFVSFAYSGAEGEATLGDGVCSYDAADAEVVGDLGLNEWTTGGDLMGDLTVASALGG